MNNQGGLGGDPGALLGQNERFWIRGNSGEVTAALMSSLNEQLGYRHHLSLPGWA